MGLTPAFSTLQLCPRRIFHSRIFSRPDNSPVVYALVQVSLILSLGEFDE